jgi:ABC-type multidrug transport system fused ATPase/permease subunit
VRGPRTTLIATTSPLLLEKVDRVFVLDHARVVDAGTHDELTARSARYRQIVLREEGE